MIKERIDWIDLIRAFAIILILIVEFHVSYEITKDPALRPIGFIGNSLFS